MCLPHNAHRLVRLALSLAVTTALLGSAVDAAASLPPGVTYREQTLSEDSAVYCLEMDTTAATTRLRLGLTNGQVCGTASALEIAQYAQRQGSDVVAAINGGAFTMGDPAGIPVGFLLQDREIYTDPYPGEERAVLGVDEAGQVFIGPAPTLEMAFSIEDGPWCHLQHVNRRRASNKEAGVLDTSVLYTERYGGSTGTDAGGTELVIRVDRGGPRGGATIQGEIVAITEEGDAPIRPGHVVLSVTDYWRADVREAAVGDTVAITFAFDDHRWNTAQFATGGTALLLQNGEVAADLSAPGYLARQSRTAVGLREDGRLIWMTADGGETDGMTGAELVAWFREQGCRDVMDLDGGGSSTFVLRETDQALHVKNTPANLNGLLRKVSNGILLVESEPAKPPVVHIAAAGICLLAALISFGGWFLRYRRKRHE